MLTGVRLRPPFVPRQIETSLVSMHDSLRKCGNVQVSCDGLRVERWRRPRFRLGHAQLFSSWCSPHLAQTHLRLREATHRLTAEFINGRVQVRPRRCSSVPSRAVVPRPLHSPTLLPPKVVSAIEALVLVSISIFQVYYLRSLFTEKPNRCARHVDGSSLLLIYPI
jgi:hypothetical protein